MLLLYLTTNANRTIMISPLNDFLLSSSSISNGFWKFGLSAELQSIPSGHQYISMIMMAGNGVKKTILQWGEALLRAKGTQRLTNDDITLEYLGVFTDNGAWCTSGGFQSACNQTYMYQLATYLKSEDIPINYLMLDDWWYNGDPVIVPCTKDFLPKHNLFPDGLLPLNTLFGGSLMLYMMAFCKNNTFLSDKDIKWISSMPIVPTNRSLWNAAPDSSKKLYQKLFALGHQQGMNTFEVDFTVQNFQATPLFRQNLTAASIWLQGMSDAAIEAHPPVPIQWCTSTIALLMQTVMLPGITQIRASEDYACSCVGEPHYGTWNIGGSSLIMSALGIKPSKDVLFSTRIQKDLKIPKFCGHCALGGHDVELGMFVATLSTGPVGLGDGIGSVNKTLVMQSCRLDGMLLQPDAPATSIDATWGNQPPTGNIWSTYALCDVLGKNVCFYYVLAIDVAKEYILSVLDFYPEIKSGQAYVARAWHFMSSRCVNGSASVDCGIQKTLEVDVKTGPKPNDTYIGEHSFELFTFFPVSAQGYALLGEWDKITSISAARFKNVSFTDGGGVSVTMDGAPDEHVRVVFLVSHETIMMKYVTFNSSGRISLLIGPQ